MSRWIWSDGGGRYDSKDGHRYLSNKQEWKEVNMDVNWYMIVVSIQHFYQKVIAMWQKV